jgi:hypothetical protein
MIWDIGCSNGQPIQQILMLGAPVTDDLPALIAKSARSRVESTRERADSTINGESRDRSGR